MNRIQRNITLLQHTSILPALLPPSAVHNPTTSFNPFLFQPNSQMRIQDFGKGGSNLRNSGQSRHNFVTLHKAYTLHEMIEINMKIEICERRTLTLGTLSMISLEVDFVNIYYNVFNNAIIIYIGILQDLTVHT